MNKKVIKIIIIVVLLAFPLLVIENVKDKAYVQNTADCWDSTGKSSYVSAFISKSENINEINMSELDDNIKQTLLKSNVLSDENVYTYAYSSSSKVNIESEQGSKEVTAFGIGGDFFVFHPLTLVSGAYFNSDNQSGDLIVIDEDVAWSLFGSAQVEGMQVSINGIPHTISGVIKREDGWLYKQAGSNKPTIYMSYMSLRQMDENLSITSYEVVMPNITKNYAKNIVSNFFIGSSDVTDMYESDPKTSEEYCEIIENTGRFDVISIFRNLNNYIDRSMKKSSVVYPYWENVARGLEDICVIMLVLEIVVIIYVIIKVIAFIRSIYLKKTRKIQVENVIFDIGNVLAEFIPEEYLRRMNFSEDKIELLMENVIGGDIWNEYDKGIMNREEAVDEFVKNFPELTPEIHRIFNNLNGIVKRFTFTDMWIEDLQNKGKKVYFISNMSEALYNDCKAELNFVDNTEGGIFSFEAKCIKPNKMIYQMFLEKFELAPEKCLFIDDRQENVEMAKVAGFNALLFTNYLEITKEINKKYN